MCSKVKMAMIGGSQDAFIGAIHRNAAFLDGQIELVAGAFSRDHDKCMATGEALGLDRQRCYPSYDDLLEIEAQLPANKRVDFISIVTPNFLHLDPAIKSLKAGFHVMLDKPMTFDLKEAKVLAEELRKTDRLLGLSHTYSGYPMVKEAKQIIEKGQLGSIRKILVEYPQGWLSTPVEQTGNKQATWRLDPEQAGKSSTMADIGVHAAHLAEYISGLKIQRLAADLHRRFNRQLEDDGNVLLSFDQGVNGALVASQIAAGEENNLKIRIYGEYGSLEWSQMEPNSLIIRWLNAPTQIWRAGSNHAYLSEQARKHCRLPAGHPEGYIEAFANLYRNFAFQIKHKNGEERLDIELFDVPGIEDGVRGMNFIEKVVESSEKGACWVDL